jgi:DNA replication and repair protein RecF
VVVRLERGLARETLSRGQQKLVAAAMTLAQLNLVRELTGTLPTLLLDDPAAELDGSRLARFAAQVRSLKCQLVVTSLSLQASLFGEPDRVFHVEQGEVRPV